MDKQKPIGKKYSKFKESLTSLRSYLFGKSVVSIDSTIEKVTAELVSQRHFDTNTVIELNQRLSELLTKNEQSNSNKTATEQSQLLKILRNELKQKSVGPGARQGRYKKIDYITDNNPQIAQALAIYIDNILASDIYTKTSLDILCKLPKIEDSTEFEEIKALTHGLINTLDIENKLSDIVYHYCKYGDCFIEIENPKEELIYAGVLKESDGEDLFSVEISVNSNNFYRSLKTDEVILYECKENDNQIMLNKIDVIPLAEAAIFSFEGTKEREDLDRHVSNPPQYQQNTPDQDLVNKQGNLSLDNISDEIKLKSKWVLDNIRLKIREPWRVTKLEVDGVIFGYLVSEDTGTMESIRKDNAIAADVIERISQDILRKIGDVINNEELKKNNKALNIIYDLLKNKQIVRGQLKARFVTPDRLEAFTLTPSKFKPYGQTILYPVLETAHLLTTLRHALVIYRLARAPEKRVVNVETGLSRDAATVIEETKQELDKKEITAEQLGSVDTISTVLSMFETIYLPMTDGKKWVEFDVMSGGQLTDKIEDINFVLKEVISGLGIPPALLGYEQDVESKATLSQQHIRFARTITQLQKQVSLALTSLLLKVFKILYPKQYLLAIETLNVVLKPPTSLLLNSLSEKADQLEKLVGVLKEFGYATDKIIAYFLGDIIDSETLALSKELKDITDNVKGTNNEEENNESKGGGLF